MTLFICENIFLGNEPGPALLYSRAKAARKAAEVLAGLGVGGAVGGLVGALVGMGIPEYEAKRYEGRVKEGGAPSSI